MSVGEYARLAHAAIDETRRRAGRRRSSAAARALPPRRARRPRACRRRPATGARERWEAVYDERGPAHAHGRLADLDPRAAARVHANDRRRVVRALELAEAGASLVPDDDRLWASTTRHPTLDRRARDPAGRARAPDRERGRGDVRAGRRGGGAGGARSGGVSRTAAKALGSTRSRTLPADEAREASHPHPPLRGVPAEVDAADPGARLPFTPTARRGEIADEILEMARARQRLPAGGGAGADA